MNERSIGVRRALAFGDGEGFDILREAGLVVDGHNPTTRQVEIGVMTKVNVQPVLFERSTADGTSQPFTYLRPTEPKDITRLFTR